VSDLVTFSLSADNSGAALGSPLTCQLHHGLIAHDEHLTSRCQGWTDDMTRSQGWAPEVA
jgi:hypothetical protein